MTNPFDPQADYNVPKGDSKYLKFEDGQTEFIPLDSAIVGWEYWNKDGKPVRLSEEPKSTPSDIRIKDRKPEAIKHFWAFPVWDYADRKVKVLELTQKTIMNAIRTYTLNAKWGSPVLKYSITVSKSGEGLNTEYTIMANPSEPIIDYAITEAWEQAKTDGFDLGRLFIAGGDPFTASTN